jgi:superfamily II DNA or RNA helicase
VAPEPGWYADPYQRHPQRWWDGSQWTSNVYTADGRQFDESQSAPTPAATAVPIDSGDIRALTERARRIAEACRSLLEARRERRLRAAELVNAMRDEVVRSQMASMPVERLREAQEGLRLGALQTAGYGTVDQVARAGITRLDQVPGVGPKTANDLMRAVGALEAALRRDVRMSFDIDRRPEAQGDALLALHDVEVADTQVGPIEADVAELARSIDELLPPALRGTSKLRMFFSSGAKKEQAAEAVAALAARLDVSSALIARIDTAMTALEADHTRLDDAWADYERRSVAYNELLAEIGGLAPPAEAAHGFIPDDVVARVEAQPLDTSLMKVKLRGYQAFGAKFALVQQRSMIGDEMGLGKTIEALAVACHLSVAGERHALVVCPASVLVNWSHEIERHTQLPAHRLHGSDKGDDVAEWVEAGGVGVTTFETLAGLGPAPEGLDLGLLVVDEAHYVKNPSTRRTKAVLNWIPEARRTMFLTGTPMENRVEEFRTLVRHLKPDVAAGVQSIDGLAGAATFRAGVASVYLRRNQTDVLLELPPRIETEDWLPLVGADLDAYRAAVAEGNFMRMRRAAYAPGTVEGSAKLDRLMEIVDEAVDNGRKVVVFTFFRGVIATVMTALGPHGVGPITGDVPPVARQQVIDDFTARADAAVLVGQIEASGVGLNIQTANVVVLCEPQWKPSVEEQAIARCHRMGQLRPVEVHRLLSEDSVDEHMRRVLAGKSALIAEYAKKSDMKEASAAAIDAEVIEGLPDALSQPKVEQAIIDAESRRLGVAAVQ